MSHSHRVPSDAASRCRSLPPSQVIYDGVTQTRCTCEGGHSSPWDPWDEPACDSEMVIFGSCLFQSVNTPMRSFSSQVRSSARADSESDEASSKFICDITEIWKSNGAHVAFHAAGSSVRRSREVSLVCRVWTTQPVKQTLKFNSRNSFQSYAQMLLVNF